MNIVFFDFDGTLTIRDTLRPYANYLARKNKAYHKLFIFYSFYLLYRLGLISDKGFKEIFLKLFIAGKDIQLVEKDIRSFKRDILQNLINNTVLEKLITHVVGRDEVYIVSANFDFFLKTCLEEWKLAGIISTETAKEGSHVTGRIIGDTCKGENKMKKIVAILGEEVLEKAIAYGDAEDIHILSKVKQGIKVA
jgi:phosphatidylglycerophosphatase C